MAGALGRDGVAVSWRNLSALGPASLGQARAAFESALRESGAHIGYGAAEARMTLSENPASFLLTAELKHGEDRQVWIASWKRTGAPAAPTVVLDKRLLFEHHDPILDAAALPVGLLVLTPSEVIQTSPRRAARLETPRPVPRDPRGRLRVNGAAWHAHLPGLACNGTLEPLTATCKPSDDPWTLDSGRAILLAAFAPNRNYFDGRVVTQAGARRTVGPFYSAAPADNLWILTGLDGRAAFFDGSLEPAGAAGSWGSDVAASDTRCGGLPVVLATRAGDGPDAVQAYTIANRAAVAVGAPVEMPGPVTALWPPGTAVARAGSTYQAYAIAVTCGQ
jgi:hypothetical protein